MPVCRENDRKAYLAKAKADLARHIRNAKKNA